MCQDRHSRLRVLRKAALRLFLVLLAACASIPSLSIAACLPMREPALRALQGDVGRDANAALVELRTQLDAELKAPRPDSRRLAALYSIEAQAFSILELVADTRAAVAKGLQYATAIDDPVRLDLLATLAMNVYGESDIETADQAIEAAHKAQPVGSLADTCLLIGRGLMQSRAGHDDLAISSLTQAYRASKDPAFAEARVLAAGTLSSVLRNMGDYEQALVYNAEAIAGDIAQNATMQLSVDRFLRGRILSLLNKYASAIDEFQDARSLSEHFGDSQGVAFADVRLCEARIELGQLDSAAESCRNALRVFAASRYSDEAKDAKALLARIELAKGHPEVAVSMFNEVLDQGGADLLPTRIAALYEWRARSNAALHRYREAYGDLTEYVRRYVVANDREHGRQAAALRAEFQTDREIETNALLKRELDISEERAARQALQLRWNAILVFCGLVTIVLLVYFLIVTLRYRRQLTRLANIDGLTELPNRRRTAEMAQALLLDAKNASLPICVVLMDLDHFKFINDRCGHATGDQVLKEFASASREALRAEDVLGRWGGEEFLLIMPQATMALALSTLERLRTRLLRIELPPSGAGLRVSVSAGVASDDNHTQSLDELIARADSALYVAKHAGRDMVRVADETLLTSSGIRRTARPNS